MASCLVELVGKLILYLFLRLLLTLVALIVATPVILMIALFGRRCYSESVRDYYQKVADFTLMLPD